MDGGRVGQGGRGRIGAQPWAPVVWALAAALLPGCFTSYSDEDVPGDVARDDAAGDVGHDDASTDAAHDDAAADATDGDGCATACLATALEWGDNGGDVMSVDRSRLDPCGTFTQTRTFNGGDPPPPARTCSNVLAGCGATGAAGIEDVFAVLADPDVLAATVAAPILYGVDSRPVDGSVFQIEVGGRLIEIGGDCPPGTPGCIPAPSGVKAAANFLRLLTAQRLTVTPCDTVFGGG